MAQRDEKRGRHRYTQKTQISGENLNKCAVRVRVVYRIRALEPLPFINLIRARSTDS